MTDRTTTFDRALFIALLNHEIRTPLNAIVGSNELCRHSQSTQDRERWHQRIDDNAQALRHTLEGLLTLAEADAGEAQVRPVATDVVSVVERTAGLFRDAAARKALQIIIEISPTTPRLIQIDRLRVESLLMCLLRNAVHFTERGHISIGLRPGRGSKSIILEVADTGIGIAPGDRHRIFERGVRVDAAPGSGGLGLGLAIATTQAELLGGTLRMGEPTGQGTRFEAELPCTFEDSTPAIVPDHGRPPVIVVEPYPPLRGFDDEHETEAAIGPPPLRILLAEDHEDSRALVRAAMQRAGHELHEAPDGIRALALALEHDYDIVLLDIEMPHLDGLAVARSIRQRERANDRPRTPIIAVTARAHPEDLQRASTVDLDAYVVKPISPRALVEIVEHHSRSPSTTAVVRPPTARDLAEIGPDLTSLDEDVRELMPVFLGARRRDLAALHDHLQRSDYRALTRMGHNIKGTAASYGFASLSILGKQLEAAGRRADTAAVHQLAEQLAAHLQRINDWAIRHGIADAT